MNDESITFGASLISIVAGLVIALYGVMLNSGQTVNTPLVVGGIVLLLGIGILTTGILTLEESPA